MSRDGTRLQSFRTPRCRRRLLGFPLDASDGRRHSRMRFAVLPCHDARTVAGVSVPRRAGGPARCLVPTAAMAIALVLAACAAPAPPPAPAPPSTAAAAPTPPAAPSVADLVDARASSGESAMQTRGFTVARQRGLTAFWWNATAGSCVRTVTANGRYSVVETVAAANCGR